MSRRSNQSDFAKSRVIKLVAEGLSDSVIGERLGKSARAIRDIRRSLGIKKSKEKSLWNSLKGYYGRYQLG